MSILKRILLIGLLLQLAACGTTPTPLSEATSPPSSRVFASPAIQSPNPATLTIIRDSGLHGAEHVIEILVNDSLVVELRQGEKHSVSVNPGPVFIEARFHNILGKVPPVQIETTFAAGKNYVYRAGLDELTLRLLRDLNLSR